MKINWGKLFEIAVTGGIILKTVSDINKWITERVNGLRYKNTYYSTLIETAYDVAKMNGDMWSAVQGQLSVEARYDEQADFLLKYCEYVVAIEMNDIKELLSYQLREAWDVFSFNARNMKDYQMAAYYGVLKAYSESNMKARALLQSYDRLLEG